MNSEFKQTVIGTYDRAAHLYDQVGARRFSYFGNLLIDGLNIPSGAHILDLASWARRAAVSGSREGWRGGACDRHRPRAADGRAHADRN